MFLKNHRANYQTSNINEDKTQSKSKPDMRYGCKINKIVFEGEKFIQAHKTGLKMLFTSSSHCFSISG